MMATISFVMATWLISLIGSASCFDEALMICKCQWSLLKSPQMTVIQPEWLTSPSHFLLFCPLDLISFLNSRHLICLMGHESVLGTHNAVSSDSAVITSEADATADPRSPPYTLMSSMGSSDSHSTSHKHQPRRYRSIECLSFITFCLSPLFQWERRLWSHGSCMTALTTHIR